MPPVAVRCLRRLASPFRTTAAPSGQRMSRRCFRKHRRSPLPPLSRITIAYAHDPPPRARRGPDPDLHGSDAGSVLARCCHLTNAPSSNMSTIITLARSRCSRQRSTSTAARRTWPACGRSGASSRSSSTALGFTTRWVDGAPFKRAGHLIAEHPGTGRQLLLIGHLDTVFEPDSPFQKFERLNATQARGPGIIDMKGGDVIIVQALKALQAVGALKNMHIDGGDDRRRGVVGRPAVGRAQAARRRREGGGGRRSDSRMAPAIRSTPSSEGAARRRGR